MEQPSFPELSFVSLRENSQHAGCQKSKLLILKVLLSEESVCLVIITNLVGVSQEDWEKFSHHEKRSKLACYQLWHLFHEEM